MSLVKKVVVFGGTHGNEWTGIYAVTRYAERLHRSFPALSTSFILANPEAFRINRRYRDEDLNRAFEFLHEDRPLSYEHHRAHELKRFIEEEPCFVLDLHTTTSHMGSTVIISHDHPLNFYVAQKLTRTLPETKIIFSPDPKRKYLASQSELGLMIEVGPVANGLVDGRALEKTLALIQEVLRVLATSESVSEGSVEIYEESEDVYYPQDDAGAITGFIHPELQGRDFHPVDGKFNAFKLFSGENVSHEARGVLYPIFINEAAYYPAKLAFTLCKRKEKRF